MPGHPRHYDNHQRNGQAKELRKHNSNDLQCIELNRMHACISWLGNCMEAGKVGKGSINETILNRLVMSPALSLLLYYVNLHWC